MTGPNGQGLNPHKILRAFGARDGGREILPNSNVDGSTEVPPRATILFKPQLQKVGLQLRQKK